MKISMFFHPDTVKGIFPQKYIDRLSKSGDVFVYDRENFDDKAHILDFLANSDIIITSWGTPPIDEEIIAACPNLKGVFHAAGTVKPILSDALMARTDIRLTAAAVAIGEGVAESALAFAISACKGAFTLPKYTRDGLWSGPHKKQHVKDFYDINVGVISAGFVGRHMIKLLKNYHVNTLVYDPTLTPAQAEELGVRLCELPEFLSECDVISIHAPNIPATHHLINKDNIGLLKENVTIVNTARGTIFDEPYLIERLKEKNGMFACIDITEVEPPAEDNELRFLENVNLTPHIAGTVSNGLPRIALHICEETERFVAGERMRTEINRESLSKMA